MNDQALGRGDVLSESVTGPVITVQVREEKRREIETSSIVSNLSAK